ncbi:M20/M25/M40 family metallo-hydrolase [Mucilaginibacter glaciei]|uniref:M20/M25/M40 family metallo-hydrolase n=1 Tax=Mucilaginibacter glaciei TaxID=2772109 RepID=A0A926NW86_9SPHI|nr:M20/M25/M40 family metallo-hydrolase [Mucilaginibacter glaciei]MBD1395190.1 M20/M25/M40 family metallo-hydrolase [Mucilaginibacter glaciei]
MRIKLYAALAALAIAPSLVSAQDAGFTKNVDKLIKSDDVERIIKTLSADDMQGRGIFTPGIDKAATFIEGEFKQAGIKPLTGNTGFRQNFSMVQTKPVSAKVTLNGAEVAADNIAITAAASFKWESADGVTVVNIPAGKNFASEYQTLMATDKKTLVLLDTSYSSFFKRIVARAKRGGTSFSKAGGVDYPKVFVMAPVADVKSLEVSYEVTAVEKPLFNVAGMIPGKSKPNEYVVFSGHYDHLGIVKAMNGDSIANGADDDASGTTAVISLAKFFKKAGGNERTLIFVAFTAEESGGYGSQFFSKQLNADQVVAMFNIEMIGKDSKFGPNTAFITGFERSDFGPILQKNLEGTAFKFYPDPYPQQNLFYRSDNATLARLGVPAHSISTDQIDTDKLYHSVGDEFASLDTKNIVATIKALALGSRSIVAGKDTPTRVAKLDR